MILATLVVQGLTLIPLIRVLDLDAAVPDLERLRAIHTQRIRRASPIDLGDGDEPARAQAARRRLRHETLSAERRALLALRDRDIISDEVFHRLEQELDVEAMRIGIGEARD